MDQIIKRLPDNPEHSTYFINEIGGRYVAVFRVFFGYRVVAGRDYYSVASGHSVDYCAGMSITKVQMLYNLLINYIADERVRPLSALPLQYVRPATSGFMQQLIGLRSPIKHVLQVPIAEIHTEATKRLAESPYADILTFSNKPLSE